MKKHFLTGLIILLPFLLTVMIILYLFDIFTGPFVGLVEGLIISYEEKRGIILAPAETFCSIDPTVSQYLSSCSSSFMVLVFLPTNIFLIYCFH